MAKYEEATIDQICDAIRGYYTDAPLDLVREAYAFAEKAHSKQKRADGLPYITHPTAVALILARMRLDVSSIITGLLHDTIEDTDATIEEIEKLFTKDVAQLVEGVTKLSKISFQTTEEKQAENFRKMLLAMAKDIRVILVKLADRTHNMRTLSHLPPHKQKRIAQETLDIYAPIANRLGISWMKIELEDNCLRYLHPDVYYKLAEKVNMTRKEREKYIEDTCEILSEKLKDYDIEAQVSGRAKHFYSAYKKMERRGADFEEIQDLIAFRIVVENITECYKTLGVIHATYKPVPGRFKDYIAMPKANSYQSLHTTVIGPSGERIEIQIRTQDMHQVADGGIAAHWKYKEGRFDSNSKENVDWVNRLLEWQKDLIDANEFMETVRLDLFEEDVFVFTPKGSVKQLPHGATPLDFAYAVHTDVGNKCVSAKVNGKIVPLRHSLKSGDTIEIITSSTQSPNKDWLKIVKTSRAKARIRQFIKTQERQRSLELGQELIDKALKPYHLSLSKVEKSGQLQKLAEPYNLRSVEDLYIRVGYGRIMPEDVIRSLIPREDLEKYNQEVAKEEEESFLRKVFKSASKKSESKTAIQVANLNDIMIRFARCCNPLPGDSIIGFITRGRGVTIHTSNCQKALDMDSARSVEVQWNIKNSDTFKRTVKIKILSLDTKGLLALISQTITACGVNIVSANIQTTKDKKAVALFDVEVSDTKQLDKITSALESKKGIIAVERTTS